MDQSTYNLFDILGSNLWGFLAFVAAGVGAWLVYILARPKVKVSMKPYRVSNSNIASQGKFPMAKKGWKGSASSIDVEFIQVLVHNRRSSDVSISEIGFNLDLVSKPSRRGKSPASFSVAAPKVKGFSSSPYDLEPVRLSSHETKSFLMPVWPAFDDLRRRRGFLPMRVRAFASVLESEAQAPRRSSYILTAQSNSLFRPNAPIDFDEYLTRCFVKTFEHCKLDLDALRSTVQAIVAAMGKSPIDTSVKSAKGLADAPTSAVEVISRHFKEELKTEDLYLAPGVDIDEFAYYLLSYILARNVDLVDTQFVHEEFLWPTQKIRDEVIRRMFPGVVVFSLDAKDQI